MTARGPAMTARRSLEELHAMLPSIRWEDPVKVHWEGDGKECYACRVCIANLGLARASKHQWQTFKECADHIRSEHI